MAEAAAGACASCLLPWCCAQLTYIVEAGKYVRQLRGDVDDLAAATEGVKEHLEAAKQRGKKPDATVEHWVGRSDALYEDAQKVLSVHDAMRLPRLNLWSRYKLGRRAVRERRKAKDLIDEKPKLELGALPEMSLRQEKQIETKVVGMAPYLAKALEYIGDDKTGVIGICGMGGVGKSTLLRHIHGEFLPGKVGTKEYPGKVRTKEVPGKVGTKEVELFAKVLWAVVYKKSSTAAVDEMESDIPRLQNDIAKQLGLKLAAYDNSSSSNSKQALEERALPIHELLSNKSFLLLLDDLWSPLELRSIGVPSPAMTNGGGHTHKHKVVLTSRSKQVYCQMQGASGALISVDCLNEEDARQLFEFHVTSQTIASHGEIEELAPKVMRECKGLPLALNTIGKALSSKFGDPIPWRNALHKLQEAGHVEIPGMAAANADMLERLKISYDYLPSDRDRQCLLSCCLWPEKYSIDKAKLIECWLGLGLEIDNDDIGMVIITSLQQVCLLEPGDDAANQVKMHDTIRDMSLWISSDCGATKNKWLVKAGVELKTAQGVLQQLQQHLSPHTERVSLIDSHIKELPSSSSIRHLGAPKALMLQSNLSLCAIPASFLRSASSGLTYLDLSKTGIQEIPAEIGLVGGLEYLNLSESHIGKLPNELSSLTKLRYLLAATMHLTTVPHGIISNCKQLQTLDVFGSRYAAWAGDCGGGASINEFKARGDTRLKLGITLGSVQALRELARCCCVQTRRLCLTNMPTPPSLRLHVQPSSLQEFLGCLDILKSVQMFTVGLCRSISQVLVDVGKDNDNNNLSEYYCFPALEKLELISLANLEHILFRGITPGVFFPRLHSVKIHNCPKLRNLNWTLYLPDLLNLDIQFCAAIEALIQDDDPDTVTEAEHSTCNQIQHDTFPVLKTLTIHSLKNLTSFSRGRSVSFPAMQVVGITQCAKLSQLQGIRGSSKLREIRGGMEWWQRLQWEEPSLQKELETYFKSQG